MTRKICLKVIMLLKELELCLSPNYPLRIIYSILISNIVDKPTLNIYFEKLFESITLDWSKMYLLPRLATIDTTLYSFQYKILNNVLFLNKNLYNFEITDTALCSFCKAFEETPIRVFYDCINLFGKTYRRNFSMILLCHHLHHRLPFLD